MKNLYLILFVLLIAFVSCDELPYEKPKDLVKEKKMIDMLVDIHIADATYAQMRYDSLFRNTPSSNFYYSILEKYQVPDSVFEKSLIYYSSTPKEFEAMYRKVMNKLSVIEQEYSGRKNELLDLEPEK